MRVTLRFRRTILPRSMPEEMELSSGRTLKFNIRGGFAVYAYQGVDSLTEAEMDEVDSKRGLSPHRASRSTTSG